MRTFIFLCCTLTFAFNSKSSFSQNVEITIDADKLVSVEEVFELIKKQTDYTFIYRSDVFKNAPKVKLKKGVIKAHDLLLKSLSFANITYELTDKRTIRLKEGSKDVGNNLRQQKISGQISDSDGIPLVGVTVLVKGNTSTGTSTDFDGNFTISANQGDTLVFSYVGYQTQEIIVTTSTTINVTLVEAIGQLNEVVVTGYSTKSRQKLTSAISTISADVIENVPVASIDNILQGAAPGLLVTQNSGEPGATASVLIRGVKNINTQAFSSPLFILDGAQIDESDFTAINPNDIASVSVLKDAAATQIYGSRGAKGVVVITTKKGVKGKTRFEYNTQLGFSSKPSFTDGGLRPLTTAQTIDLQHEFNIGSTVNLTTEELDALRLVNTDWLAATTRSGSLQTHEIRISGGTDKTDYFISGGLYDQSGTVKRSELKRYTTRVKVNHKIGNLKLGVNVALGRVESERKFNFGRNSIGNPFFAAFRAFPYDRVFDPVTGDFARPLRAFTNSIPNTLEYLETQPSNLVRNRVNGIFNAEYKVPFVKGLSLRTLWSIDYSGTRSTATIPAESLRGPTTRGGQGQYSEDYADSNRYTGTNSIHYNFTLGENHVFNISGYQEYIRTKRSSFGATLYGLSRVGGVAGASSGRSDPALIPRFRAQPSDAALSSLFTTVDYSYDDKYNLTMGVRRDGAHNFGRNNRFGNFYSAGFGWVLSQEKFMSKLGFVDFAKLRTSYGTVGNTGGGNDNRQIFSPTNGYGGVPGIVSNLFNPDIKWETTKKFDIGLDLTLFNDFLSLGVDYYNEETIDLLDEAPLSYTTGFDEFDGNFGSLRSTGVELSLSTNNIRTENFKWSTAFNIATNTTKVIDLVGDEPLIINPFKFEEGQELGRFYFVRSAGVNPVNGRLLYYTRDGDLTETYNEEDDRVDLGRRTPKYFGGLTNTFSYKGLQLSVLITYAQDYYVRNSLRQFIDHPSNVAFAGVATSALRVWRQPGDITDIPNFESGGYERYSSVILEDASFIKIRNVQLGYTIPDSILKTLSISGLDLYLQGQNLFTFTKFSGGDPENSSNEFTASYPGLRTFTLGLNVKF